MTRLVILWLLSEGPLHGYRMKRILDDEGLSFWFPTEYASIYAVLRTLVKSGYVKIVAVEREGLRPERTRYAITRAGRQHFKELLEQAWREPPSLVDPFQLALAARSELGEPRVAVLAGERLQALKERMADLERIARAAPAAEVAERQMALVGAELAWTKRLLASMGGREDGK